MFDTILSFDTVSLSHFGHRLSLSLSTQMGEISQMLSKHFTSSKMLSKRFTKWKRDRCQKPEVLDSSECLFVIQVD